MVEVAVGEGRRFELECEGGEESSVVGRMRWPARPPSIWDVWIGLGECPAARSGDETTLDMEIANGGLFVVFQNRAALSVGSAASERQKPQQQQQKRGRRASGRPQTTEEE